MIDIEEKTISLWNARFDVSDTNQSKENSFQVFRNKDDDFLNFNIDPDSTPGPQLPITSQSSITTEPTNPNIDVVDWWQIIDIPTTPTEPLKPSDVPSPVVHQETINYTSPFNLKITSISLPPSVLFETSRSEAEKSASKTSNTRFVITFKNGEATMTSILCRFILDQQLKFTPPENYFSVFDSLGRYIDEDCQIKNIYRSDEQNSIHIRILRCNENANICCEMTLTANQEKTQSQYFNPTTTWKQISLWSKILDIKTETPVDSYYFWNTEQKHIIDEDLTISFTLGQAESINVDALNRESVMDIILSYDKISQTIRILNSCPVHCLIWDPKYLKELNLKISPQDCTLVFVSNESEKQILNNLD
ncbi:unnamed protein product, partial [Rotaria sordida]